MLNWNSQYILLCLVKYWAFYHSRYLHYSD